MMKYKMTIYPAIETAGNLSKTFMFETSDLMIAAKETAADLLLFLQNEAKVMYDYSNMFLFEENVDGEWEEYKELDELEV